MLGCIQPMSSPMMNRMLGFCSCAAAGALAIVARANDASRPSQAALVMRMVATLHVGCPRRAGSLCPPAFAARSRRDDANVSSACNRRRPTDCARVNRPARLLKPRGDCLARFGGPKLSIGEARPSPFFHANGVMGRSRQRRLARATRCFWVRLGASKYLLRTPEPTARPASQMANDLPVAPKGNCCARPDEYER